MPDVRRIKEKAFIAAIVALTMVAVAPLFHIIASVAIKGSKAVIEAGPSFILDTPAPPGASYTGGIGPALLGSAWLGVLSALLGIPLALFTAVFIVEFRDSKLGRAARIFTNSLLEVPTVLIGMLVYVVIVVPMGGYSILAGAIALAIVMLPYTVSYVERALDGVPRTYREAGFSIGMTRSQVVFRVVMGIARRGVLAGILIGIAKAIGETAPLLFTVGSARNNYPTSPGDVLEPGDAVPLLIYQFAQSPFDNWHDLAWGAALVLTLIVLLVFIAMRVVVREVRV